MKKQFIAALFLGLGLVSINSQSSYAYKDYFSRSITISNNKNLVNSTLREINFSDSAIKNLNINGTKIATEAQIDLAKQSPSVTLKNGGGYVMNYTIYYMENQNFGGVVMPVPKVLTGTLTSGMYQVITWPKSAKNIFLKVQAVGRGDYFIDRVLEPSGQTCFYTYGTVFSPQYNTDGVCPSQGQVPKSRSPNFGILIGR
jgi:hypothetical protein